MDARYSDAIKRLETLFDQFNEHFYAGKLETPIIAVLPDTSHGAYGWCTTQRVWVDDKVTRYEINLCAEWLGRPFENVVETLLHEMVHLYNLMASVQDTSRNGRYHNRKYRDAAISHGLDCEKDSTYGWTLTKLSSSTAEWVQANCDTSDFNLSRVGKKKTPRKPRKPAIRYMCPVCGDVATVRSPMDIMCNCSGEPVKMHRFVKINGMVMFLDDEPPVDSTTTTPTPTADTIDTPVAAEPHSQTFKKRHIKRLSR